MKLLLSLFFSVCLHAGDTIKSSGDSTRTEKKVVPPKKETKASYRMAPSILIINY